MIMAKISSRSFEVTQAWRDRKPFETYGALKGVSGKYYTSGKMPSAFADVYNALRDDAVAYTVVSYDTPIAYVLTDGLEIKPPVKYSVTTSKHQGKIY